MVPIRGIGRIEGSLEALSNILLLGRFTKAYAAGGGAGAAVTVAVTGLKELPANYHVHVEAPEDVTTWITAKTSAGFTVNIAPRLAASTIVGGNINILIVG